MPDIKLVRTEADHDAALSEVERLWGAKLGTPEGDRRVLERDGWRCQGCGRRERLEVHHLERRGRGEADREANLITLCAGCHRRVHQGREL